MSGRPRVTAPGSRVSGADGLHSPLSNDQRDTVARRRAHASAALELVDETTDEEIDLDALHALAALLVSCHRRTPQRSEVHAR